jgi:2-polyprenyl-3-methyl-5-hydroxy-6-metoxy-1,4-benzoquinol methylase
VSESGPASQGHYSYTVYADPVTARTFDSRRFGGPIGELIAAAQARVLADFAGGLHDRPVLDVGTGTGRAALVLARAGARVTGVDPSEEMLAVARSRAVAEGASVSFRLGDAHALEFPDQSFDAVVCLRVLMHAPDWRRCTAELCRVAGRLVILDYPSARSIAVLQSAVRRVAGAVGIPTEAYRVFTDREIGDALARSGFRVRSMHRQFVLPIALHKAIGSPRLTTTIERMLGRLGLLKAFGSPVTLVAERCATS